jgi:hypothetical protein
MSRTPASGGRNQRAIHPRPTSGRRFRSGRIGRYLDRLGRTAGKRKKTGGPRRLHPERLTAGRQDPGRYRILVHNWAGGPTEVDLQITFFNQNGEPGPSGGGGGATTGLLVRAAGVGTMMQP